MTGSLLSWGRYPRHPQIAEAVHWQDELPDALSRLGRAHGTTLAYGNGRSYGDSCLAASGHCLRLMGLDRLIQADWQSGVVRIEAGATIEDLIAVALPRGWFPPVTPGTKFVTLGGCLANDVHGKNHHKRGTFGRHVRRFQLLRSDRGRIECAPEENEDLYRASIGGLGLTGVIVWLDLQLIPIGSSDIALTSIRFETLEEFFHLAAEHDKAHEYSVAWIDCGGSRRELGRGLLSLGDHAGEGPRRLARARALAVPATPPLSLVNRWSVTAFNTLYYHRQRRKRVDARTGYDRYFYPLDGILDWNRIYGPAGFQQYQCVVPEPAGEETIEAMLEAVATSGMGSFLAVLKRCGEPRSPGLLSFPLEGPTLAIDIPQREPETSRLFDRLDAILREAGGRLYPAKDAHMRAPDFKAGYPGWEKVDALRDPVLLSRFWQRVTAA